MKMLTSVAVATGILAFGASQAAAASQFPGSIVERSGNTYHVAVCPTAAAGYARCGAHIVTDANGNPLRATLAAPKPNITFTCQLPNPSQCLSPAQLRAGYNITGSGKSTTIVAIVDAFAYPTAETDLGVFRSQEGLPACTTSNGCLRIINQNGGSTPPAFANFGWDVEQALDLDMVSTMCPNCHILLVQATTNSSNNLAVAVNQAAAQGAHVISNSYGGGENGSQSYEPYYNHPGVAITASSGDSGYGAQFPATSPHVTAVGGTRLLMNGTTRTGEVTWSPDPGATGSGCSEIYGQPYWQAPSNANMAKNTLCTARMEADVSADADPATGALIAFTDPIYTCGYDTPSTVCFFTVGGTSEAAPLVGGIYGERDDTVIYGSNPYKAPSSALHDITSGFNGTCGGTYFCNAGVGYDGPTGLGSPNGDTAF